MFISGLTVFVQCECVHKKSEDSLQASVLAFSDLSSGERPQVIRLGSRHLNLLSHA